MMDSIPLPTQHVSTVAVEKTYRTGQHNVPVLRGVEMAVNRGEFVSIIGQSGSGKSTLLHLMGLLDQPTVGEIHIEGQRVDDLLATADMLSERDGVEAMHLVGVHDAGPVALHAAALDKRFASVSVRESIGSWVDDVMAEPLAPDLLGHVVPGALVKYDLPDLIRATAPRKATVLRRE